MSIFMIIKLLIEFGPMIVSLIREIIKLIKALRDNSEKDAAYDELHSAIEVMRAAKKNKNTFKKATGPIEVPLVALRDKLKVKVG